MLNGEQLLHFAEHGWVIMENVLDAEQCAAYRVALDRAVQSRVTDVSANGELTVIDNIVLYDDIFVDWFTLPGILESNRQLLGAQLKFQGVNAHIKRPHPERHNGRNLMDPDTFGWHRGLRPKWGNHLHDTDPRLINCSFLNNITYLTTVAPGNGSTGVLDGSHKLEGNYQSLKDQCPLVEVPSEAGSVLIFTETLIHTAIPILSETVRYNMYYGFTPPWYHYWPGTEVPKAVVDSLANEELRRILGDYGYVGQKAEV